LLTLFVCLSLWQCSTPIAAFEQVQGTELRAPADISFRNTSQKTDSYVWKVDGVIVSIANDLEHTIYDSGRHTIDLVAKSGKKSVSYSKEIFVTAPEFCSVLIETSAGDMVLELSEDTPRHLKQFTDLVDSEYYNGIYFHRVIDNFMIQVGDNNNRTNGKKYDEPETIPNEIRIDHIHLRGALAAARMPDDINPEKESSGSQFYIVDGRQFTADKMTKIEADKLNDYTEEQFDRYVEVGGAPQLDGEYTVFGRLIKGYDVLDKIAQTSTDKYDKPLEDIRILRARLIN